MIFVSFDVGMSTAHLGREVARLSSYAGPLVAAQR